MTDDPTIRRRLSAILAADIAGYSRLMGEDEAATVQNLKNHQAVILPLVGKHGGRIIDTAGDGILAEFPSVTEATACAMHIQAEMAQRNEDVPEDRRMRFRMGINLGDVIFDDSRIYGDGINVAARLESMADPGGILVSHAVYEQVRDRLGVDFDDLGARDLKNIARPVRIYRVRTPLAGRTVQTGATPPAQPDCIRPAVPQRRRYVGLGLGALAVVVAGGALWFYVHRTEPVREAEVSRATSSREGRSDALDARPSVAVLPFKNRSARKDDVFFVDGMHDDVLTQLSKVSALKVISRTSVEQFRNTTLSTRAIAEQLGVKSILEGGVQRAGDRVRINVQLIDASSDVHIWAESYDRELTAANIFSLQSEVAAAIAAALKATLTAAEKLRVDTIPTRSLQAWEAYQLGRQEMARRTTESLAAAESSFRKSIEIDPQFALAYVGIAETLVLRLGYTGYPLAETLEQAEAAVSESLALEPHLAEAVAGAARIALLRGNYPAAESGYRRSIELSPSSAAAYYGCSQLYGLMGRNDESLDCAKRAAELDPLSVSINFNLGRALERVGQFGDALDRYRKAIEIDPSVPTSYFLMGSVYAHAFGRLDEAIPWFARAEQLDSGNPVYALALASSNVDLGNLIDARRWLDQAAVRGAEYEDVATVDALLHLYEGALTDVVKISRKVLESNPRHRHALNLLRISSRQSTPNGTIRDLYTRAYPELAGADPPAIDGSNYRSAVDLAGVMLETGDWEHAAQLLDGGERVLRSNQRMGWEGYGMLDVQVHALRSDKAKALAALREAEISGWRSFGWRYFRDFEPSLASIRNEPEFKEVFVNIERDMATQRAALAKHPEGAPSAVPPPH